MRESELGHNMRKIESRGMLYHLSFLVILLCEALICIIVFVAGVNFVLSQSSAGAIVSGILGIAFITDIDNKGKKIRNNPNFQEYINIFTLITILTHLFFSS